MREAITNLGKETGRKIAVLGDMLELGDYSKEIHSNIGKVVNDNNIDLLITVGKDSKYINDNVSIENIHFENNEEAIKYLKEILTTGDVVLLKASNSLNFIEIVNALKGESNEN